MSKASAKSILRGIGVLLSLVAVVFILWRFVQTGALQQILVRGDLGNLVWHVAAAAALYFVGLWLMPVAWWWLLSSFSETSPALLPVCGIYAATQFAKYLPGNVGHYLARYGMLRRMGIPDRALVGSTGAEMGGQLVAALAWSLPVVIVLAGRYVHLGMSASLALVLALIAAGSATAYAVVRYTVVGRWMGLRRPWRLLWALPLYIGLFGVMTLALHIVQSALPGQSPGFFHLAGVTSASWLAGFVVIGSPAGIGVREAVFVQLMGTAVPASSALLLATCFRVITFLGDCGQLAVGVLIIGADRWRRAAQPPGGGAVSPERSRSPESP